MFNTAVLYCELLFCVEQQQQVNMKDLHNIIFPHYAPAWREIGFQLNIPSDDLNIVEANYHNDVEGCCGEMLCIWTQREIKPNQLWGNIIKVIDSPTVKSIIKGFPDSKSFHDNRICDEIILSLAQLKRIKIESSHETLLSLESHLKQKAIKNRFKNVEDDRPFDQPKHFTDLVLVHHHTGKTKKQDIELIASIQHEGEFSLTGLVRENPNIKTKQNISEIFAPINDSGYPDTILIEGAPGIGKTTLAKEIVFQWASKNLLVDKKLVILVYLRDPKAQHVHTLKDFISLFCGYTEEKNSVVVDYIESTKGKDMVIILDGYDEMPERLINDQDSFFGNLVNRANNQLCNCMVIITSRHTESNRFEDVVDCRVEILGFTDKKRKEHIMKALKGKNDKIESLLEYLDNNPAINAHCYVPLNMTILLHLCTEGIDNMPKTQTQIHKKFICIIITWFIKKKGKKDCSISDFSEVPSPYHSTFRSICKLAFVALQEEKIVLIKKEIDVLCNESFELSGNYSGLGLLKAIKFLDIMENSQEMSFSFLHLSVQEILAAYYITLLPSRKQLDVMKESFWDERYYNMWIMYVGLTEGQSQELWDFLSPHPLQIFTTFSFMLPRNSKRLISKKIIGDKLKCLFLFQCFSEVEKDNMDKYFDQSLKNREIDISCYALSAVNIHTLGLFLARSEIKSWRLLNLSKCCILTDRFNKLLDSFIQNCYRRGMTTNVGSMNVANNSLTNNSIPTMVELIFAWKIQSIDISCNEVDSDNLINAIIDNVVDKPTNNLSMNLEIINNNYHSLVVCNTDYEGLIETVNDYSCICLIKCQIKANVDEFLTNLLQKDKDVYLYRNKLQLENVIKAITVNNFSSFHYMEENITSTEVESIISTLIPSVRFAFQISTTFPLHIYNVTPNNIITDKHILMQKCISGTFLFKSCILEHVHEIISCDNFINIRLFHLHDYSATVTTDLFASKLNCGSEKLEQDVSSLKHSQPVHLDIRSTCTAKDVVKVISEVVHRNISLEHLTLCNCKVSKHDIQVLCDTLRSNTKLSSINLSHNFLTDQAAFTIGESFSRNKHLLKHIVFCNCNLSSNGLQTILNSTKQNKTLQTINFDLSNISDQNADKLAAILSNNVFLECICLQDSALSDNGMSQITKAAMSLKLLKSLDFSNNRISDQNALTISIIVKNNQNLEYLDLSNCDISETGMQKVAVALVNHQHLKVINVSGNKLTNVVVGNHLSTIITNNGNLTKLLMSDCHLQSNGFKIISESLPSMNALTHVDFSHNYFDYYMACIVAYIIYKSTNLYVVNLSYCKLKGIVFVTILQAMAKAKNLTHADLKYNELRLDDMTSDTLVEFISNNQLLEYLCLSNCNLEDYTLLKLLRVMNSCLTHLDISFNKFTSQIATNLVNIISDSHKLNYDVDFSGCDFEISLLKQLCTALKEIKSLKFLGFGGCYISHETAAVLAEVIMQGNLETIVLSKCEMQRTITIILLDALKSLSSLKRLHLERNHISDEGVSRLADIVQKNNIEYLDLSSCSLQNTDVSVLFNSMTKNSTFQFIDLSFNNLSNEKANMLSNMLAANTNLKKINLAGNNFNTDSIGTLLNGLSKLTYLEEINVTSYQFNNKLAEIVNVIMSSNSRIRCLDFEELIWKGNGVTSLNFSYKCLSALKHICISNANFYKDVTIVTTVVHNNQTIQSFCLTNCIVDNSGKVDIFASLQIVQSLNCLIFDNLTIVKECEDLIANVINNNNLKKLTLSRCDMQSSTIAKIAQGLGNHHNLTHLNMSYSTFTDYCISELSTVMAKLRFLEFLSLSNCMAKVDAKEFLRAISTTRLKHLDLSNNHFLTSEADLLGKLIARNAYLQHLNLSYCKLPPVGIENVTKQLERLAYLKHLDLSKNTLTDKAVDDVSCLIKKSIKISVVCLSNHPKEYDKLNLCASLKFKKNSKERKYEAAAINYCQHKVEYIRIRAEEWKDNWLDNYKEIQLLSISLSQNEISDETFTSILKILGKKHLTQHIELAVTNMDKNRIYELFKVLCLNKSLKYLDISHSDIPTDNIDTFVNAIELNNKLEKLYLYKCHFNSSLIAETASALKSVASLKCLNLSSIKINDRATEIADVITHNLAIEYLDFSNCGLLEKEVEIISVSLQKLRALKSLNFSDNEVTNHAAQELSTALAKNTNIEYLNLSNCRLKEAEIVAIGCELQKIHTLKILDMTSNQVINEAAGVIANVIYSNATMKKITLSNCNLRKPHDEKIFQALKETTSLEDIDLSHNAISSSKCHDLQDVLKETCSVKFLYLKNQILIRTQSIFRHFLEEVF